MITSVSMAATAGIPATNHKENTEDQHEQGEYDSPFSRRYGRHGDNDSNHKQTGDEWN